MQFRIFFLRFAATPPLDHDSLLGKLSSAGECRYCLLDHSYSVHRAADCSAPVPLSRIVPTIETPLGFISAPRSMTVET